VDEQGDENDDEVGDVDTRDEPKAPDDVNFSGKASVAA
jgi:hypothetical protein